jgi:hypothetical protein
MLIHEQWDNSFARAVIPRGASVTQRREMRRAFYAGAQGLLKAIHVSLSPDPEVEPADLQVMESIQQELRMFADLVEAGRA